ncbi:MAG: EAL domain-containing protein [gamma proteobacterium symbiont of Ctena orbiculata]
MAVAGAGPLPMSGIPPHLPASEMATQSQPSLFSAMNSSKRFRVSLDMLAHSHMLAFVFITLAILIILLIAAYWQYSLEPRLTAHANAHTNVLAQAQAGILSKSLSGESQPSLSEVEKAMDSILTLRDPATLTPLVQRVEIRLNKAIERGSSKLYEHSRGQLKCVNCIVSEVTLVNEGTGLLLGIARIHANRDFLSDLKDDIREKLWWSGAIATLIVLFAWLSIETFLRKLRNNESNLQSIIDGVADPLYAYTTDRELVLQNQAARKLALSNHGMDDEEFQRHILPPISLIREVIVNNRPLKTIHKIPQAEGKNLRMELQASPLSDGSDNNTGVIVTYRDITEYLELLDELQSNKHQLQQLAERDTLTHLPNRFMFNRLLDQAVSRAARNHSMLALLFLDLDRFKEVNDSLGHDAGDTLLEIVAKRLLKAVRRGDVVSRLSGDEFVILLEDIRRPDDATSVADHIIDSVRQMVIIQGKRLHPSLSIGISLFPNDGKRGKLLLQCADTAMYRAKRESQNSYQLYDPSMTVLVQERLNMIAALQSAVEEDDFILLFQPQYELHTKKLIGLEALLRWNREGRELVSPIHFLDLAEDVGLVYPIGQWVVRSACKQIQAWRSMGLNPPPLAVNVSAAELLHKNFVETTKATLESTRCSGEWLTIEITESLFSGQVELAANVLHRLKDLGVAIAIDDFGIEHSSLARLKQLPIDRLKLDKIFLQNLPTDSANQAIIQTVQDLGQRLDIEVVAEGVETAEQETYLILSDYRMAQGYRYGRPMTADECAKRLH